MEGLFIMTMLVDLSDLSITLDELVMGLRKIGEEINMETTLRLAGGPAERKRVAVLVTKEPHCLAQLVQDRDAGVLNGDLVVVLSNHADLEPLAREHKIPFAWAPSTDKAAHEEFLLARLGEHKPDLIVLARYMQILSTRVIDRYPFRIINPPLAAALPPGVERLQASVGGGRARLGMHGALRDRAARRRPRHPAGRVPHPRRRGCARGREGARPRARGQGALAGGAALPERPARGERQEGHLPGGPLPRRPGRRGVEPAALFLFGT